MRKLFITVGVVTVLAVGGAAAATTAATRPRPAATSSVSTSTSSVSAAPAIGQFDAGRIAADSVPGGQVTEIALLTVGGRPAWKAHVSTATAQHEVFVDAANGQILAAELSNGGSLPASPSTSATAAPASPVTPRGGTDDGLPHDLGDDHGGRR
jgi:uncharacterized membrane protein YkoI